MIQLNEFEMFILVNNDKNNIKIVLLNSVKTVSIKPCINR